MSTSGGGTLNAVLYVVVLWAGVSAGTSLLGRPPRPGRSQLVALGLWLVVAVPSLLQLPFPGLERAFRRDPDLIRHHGQVWRLLTSMTTQDGGIPATVFNLAILALVLAVAVEVWGPVRTPVLLVAGQLVFDVIAVFVSTDRGAGNSGATFALSASIAVLAGWTTRTAAGRGPAVLVVLAGAVLLILQDAHGFAVLAGAVLGGLAVVLAPPPPVGATDPVEIPRGS